jgi:hypothetical protein
MSNQLSGHPLAQSNLGITLSLQLSTEFYISSNYMFISRSSLQLFSSLFFIYSTMLLFLFLLFCTYLISFKVFIDDVCLPLTTNGSGMD